jgi:hypothetical protein
VSSDAATVAAKAAADAAALAATPKTVAERQAEALAVTAAHRAKLAAAADGTPDPTATVVTPAVTPATKPEGVPDKFWNAETGVVDFAAWATAHAALETEFHKSKEKTKTDEEKAAEQAAEAAAAVEAAKPEAVQKVAIESAQAEFAKDGKLSDASYAALEKAGYRRDMVDTYIAGQTSKASAMTTAAYEPTGGEEGYNAMTAWAAEALSEAEIKAFNAQLATNDPAVIKAATTGLFTKYKAEAPNEAPRIGGGAGSGVSGVFQSKAEMTAAMRKPSPNNPKKTLYETDAAYRAEVTTKISNSRRAGINIFV